MPISETPRVSVVVPTYHSADSLDSLLSRLDGVFDDADLSAEYILVDDRSPDDTWQVLMNLADRCPRLHALRLQRNVGQMGATMCGIAEATGDIIVTMDDDLQHPPEEIPKLLAALEDAPEWDVVIGSWERGNDGRFRHFGSRVFERAQNLAVNRGTHLRQTGFRAFRQKVGQAMVQHETRHPVLPSLILEVADGVHNVEVRHEQRAFGDSNFSFRSAVKLTVDNFVQSSALPLLWISGFGFFVAFLAGVLGLVYVIRAFAGADTPEGWASVFLAVMFLGGSILASIGLLGRYVAVIMTEVRRPPRWFVRERIR